MNYSQGTQTDELQQVVDGLAAQLGRSVAVDDPQLRLLAVSRHFGDEDTLRVRAVMQREADSPETDRMLSQGIADWDRPGRVSGDVEQGIKPRVCVPIREHGLLLAYLFLIDDSVEEWEIDRAATAAAGIGLLLYRRLVLHEREQSRDEALVRDLIAADPAVRARAKEQIDEEGLVQSIEHVVAVVVEVVDLPASLDGAEVALRAATEHAKRSETPGSVLGLVQGRRALLLLLGERLTDAAGRAIAQHVVAELQAQVDVGRCVAGLGAVRSGPDAAVVSHEQARVAARAAGVLPALGDVIAWDDLGVYALLIKLAPQELTPTLYPSGLRALVEREAGALLETAEAYLDCAGDATRTAAALHIHRSTLYYRLERIEKVTGMDLRDGHHRLTLHLGIKLSRLVGAYAGTPGFAP
ncbi:CdaR family transcriptional regulator [Saccharopolyspora aridisoli]|uniref:CdaR family transcriptional regulator n=1 Tax=Saccharopolyspora aridisoli TaxID=2530385 RepID=A0A4R4UTR0_9PSEU|nr:helix-turn-helix domain-containing protein [Saccharopolyspora aridisoli]TDC95440.1 CdaR family transcriptional regulator [Saccharopolyspora aridisoli]